MKNAVTTHLDDLLTVLRVSTDLRPALEMAAHLRLLLATRLDVVRPEPATRVRGLDDWHVEVLADFICDAHVVAEAIELPPPTSGVAEETRVG